jgi:hypothetical protein
MSVLDDIRDMQRRIFEKDLREGARLVTVCADTKDGDFMVQCQCGQYRPARSSHGQKDEGL